MSGQKPAAVITISLAANGCLQGVSAGGLHLTDQEKARLERIGRFLADIYDETAFCRVCGCSELDACTPTCYWVTEDLCSVCAGVEIGEGC